MYDDGEQYVWRPIRTREPCYAKRIEGDRSIAFRNRGDAASPVALGCAIALIGMSIYLVVLGYPLWSWYSFPLFLLIPGVIALAVFILMCLWYSTLEKCDLGIIESRGVSGLGAVVREYREATVIFREVHIRESRFAAFRKSFSCAFVQDRDSGRRFLLAADTDRESVRAFGESAARALGLDCRDGPPLRPV